MRDARGNTGPVSYFTQHLTVIVCALCDVLRSAHASTSERVLWPIPSEYADDLAYQAANLNCTRDGGGGDGGGHDRRGGGGSDGRDGRGRGSGRNHHGGFGHSSGGGGKVRCMGSLYRAKGGGGHSWSSGGKSCRQNSGRGANSYTSGPPSDFSVGGEVGSPPPDVNVVQPLERQIPSLIDVASFTESLAKMTISVESGQPLSSAFAHERQAAVDEAAARAKAEHIDAVKYKCVNNDTRKMAGITTLPPTHPNQAFAAQQLMRSVKEAQTDILIIYDSCCSRDGLKSPVGSPGGNAPSTEPSGVLSIMTNRPSPPSTPSLMTFLARSREQPNEDIPVRRLLTFSSKC